MNAPESRSLALMLPLACLAFSRTEAQTARRGRYKPDALAEMADTIRAHGILQPILVRPLTDAARAATADADLGDPAAVPYLPEHTHEIIAGERRVLASIRAGLEEIPALICLVSDEELLKVQLIENMQREEVHELEEAMGFDRLMKPPYSLTAEAIGNEIGKSRRHVQNRLALLRLVPDAREAFYAGNVSGSIALVVSSVPAYLQPKVLEEVSAGEGHEAMSYREALAHLKRNYQLRLASAPFDLKAVYDIQVDGAKPAVCGVCTKRTGANIDLFEDAATADMCMDPKCFNAKRDEAEAIQRGADEKAAKKNANSAPVPGTLDDVDDGAKWPHPQKSTSTPTQLAQAQPGAASGSGQVGAKAPDKGSAAAEDAALRVKTREAIFRAARDKMKEEIRKCGGLPHEDDVRAIALIMAEMIEDSDGGTLLAEAHGQFATHAGFHGRIAGSMPLSEVFLFMFECTLLDEIGVWHPEVKYDHLVQTARRLGVNVEHIATGVKSASTMDKLASADPAKNRDGRPTKTPATIAKKAGAAADKPEAGYWKLADLLDRVPKDCKPNKSGVYENVLVLRSVDNQRGTCELHLASAGKKFSFGYDDQHLVKGSRTAVGAGGSSGAASTSGKFNALQDALHAFAKRTAKRRLTHDPKDPVGLALEAGLKGGNGDMIIPKLFRNIGVRGV